MPAPVRFSRFMNDHPDREHLFSPLEYAPGFIVYALHWPYSLYLALKTGVLFAPATANPGILLGGMAGESKTDLHALLGAHARQYFAPFVTVQAGDSEDSLLSKLAEAKISFPLVAKPDVGRNGRGVKKVADARALMKHLCAFPAGTRMVLQAFVAYPCEAGVFYVRKPSETHGRITSLTLKHFPAVTGDGRATLRELILRDPRASKIARIYLRRNKRDLDRVIPAGERYPLVFVGNHVRGAVFEDGATHITPEMAAAFDRIARDIDGFFVGRFDVRFPSLEDLKAGRAFTVLEFNGASSEPTHVLDRRTSIVKTYRDMLCHWKWIWEIGAENRARGAKPVSVFTVLRVVREEGRLIEAYPDEE